MDAACRNAESVRSRISRLSECQLLHISDIAHCLVYGSGNYTADDQHKYALTDTCIPPSGYLREKLTSSEGFLRDYRAASRCLGIDRSAADDTHDVRFLDVVERSFGTSAKSCLCRLIWEYKRSGGFPLTLDEFFRCDSSAPDLRIAYVKNSYSDIAYRNFSEVINGSSVVYHGSFSAVCEAVYNNRAGFCILPYETSDDGVLSGFRQLIMKYELVQMMSCSVTVDTSQNGSRITRFALLSKGLKPSVLPAGNIPRYIKVILDSSSDDLIADIYTAASFNGLRHAKTESIPIIWDSDRYSCAITFALDGADPLPFLLFLALEVPGCTPDSLYTVL